MNPNSPWAQQNVFEFSRWLDVVRAAKLYNASAVPSFLEIGSCFGHSLAMTARALPKGSRIVSVDMGVGLFESLKGVDTGAVLSRRIEQLTDEGYDARYFQGDSHDPEIIAGVARLGPFDLCFIDGDHTYAGVDADWQHYGCHARITGLHDIVNPSCDVWKFWTELQREKGRSFAAFVGSDMGIGVVWNNTPRGGMQGSQQ